MIRHNAHKEFILLKDGFDLAKTKSVGLHLVNLMVSQLGGSITIKSENGTKIKIECPLEGALKN